MLLQEKDRSYHLMQGVLELLLQNPAKIKRPAILQPNISEFVTAFCYRSEKNQKLLKNYGNVLYSCKLCPKIVVFNETIQLVENMRNVPLDCIIQHDIDMMFIRLSSMSFIEQPHF